MLIPDTVKFIFALALLAGAVFGSAWLLANFPPEQAEVIRSLPHEKLRQS